MKNAPCAEYSFHNTVFAKIIRKMFKKLRKEKHLTVSLFDLLVYLLIYAKVFFLLMSYFVHLS